MFNQAHCMLFTVCGEQCEQVDSLRTASQIQSILTVSYGNQFHLLTATHQVGEIAMLNFEFRILNLHCHFLSERVGVHHKGSFVIHHADMHIHSILRRHKNIRRHKSGIDIFDDCGEDAVTMDCHVAECRIVVIQPRDEIERAVAQGNGTLQPAACRNGARTSAPVVPVSNDGRCLP